MRKAVLAISFLVGCNGDAGGDASSPDATTSDAAIDDALATDAVGEDVTDSGAVVDAPEVDAGPPLPEGGTAVVTFHSIGVYWQPPSAPMGDAVKIRYRKATEATWKTGHDLWYDARKDVGFQPRPVEARGSIVHVDPGTKYIVQFGMPKSDSTVDWVAQLTATTWSESFPVGKTLTPFTGTRTTTSSSNYLGSRSSSSRNQVLLMNESGSASGYTVYDMKGATAKTDNSSNAFPVVISGRYMILRGLKTIGGQSGIFVDPGSHHIVIEDCEITAYGRSTGNPLPNGLPGQWAVNEDAGIAFPDPSYGSTLDTKQIVIQRNKIHNPFAGSNSWDAGHPSGAAPILMYPTGGDIVVRYNEAYSTLDGTLTGTPDLGHFHQDGLVMGGDNDKGIGPDIDVYKNIVIGYFDDGMETDGDGVNDRIWGNYFDYGGASAVSTTSTNLGPVYVFRNVYNRARMWYSDPWGSERDREYAYKCGGFSSTENGGRRYLYHHTSLQPPASSQSAPGPNDLGAGIGAGGTGGSTNGMMNTVTRNNIFATWKASADAFDLTNASKNDLDYDVSNGRLPTSLEPHGKGAVTLSFQDKNGWSSYFKGAYRLAAGSPGYDDGLVIPGFNDDVPIAYRKQGAGPDRGAHEDGSPDMLFGTSASGN
jgi:hypothetical protein